MKFTPIGADGIKMPFGKHRGEPLEKVPNEYLSWAYFNVTNDYYPLIAKEFESRKLGPGDIRMPFGKYESYKISDLPDEYLAWLVTLEDKEELVFFANMERNNRGIGEEDQW